MTRISATVAMLVLVLGSGAALAQTKAPEAAKGQDPADVRFVTTDVDKSGFIDGKEVDPFKSVIAKIDTDKDGKISKQEFHVAVMTGVVK